MAGTFVWALAGSMTMASRAHAQSNGGGAPPPGGPTVVQDAPADSPSAAPGSGSSTTTDSTAGGATTTSTMSSGSQGGQGGRGNGKPAGGGQLSGYSYGSHDSPEVQAILAGHNRGGGAPARMAHHAVKSKVVAGSVATYPGFAMRDDGGSRVFVQLTKAVPVEEHRAAGQITYLLKGAHVTERNNENALVTVHFNTPVSRARLRPVGHDLALTIELRGAASPTYKMEGADGGSRLVIDFPEGQFLDNDGEPMRTARAQAFAGDANGKVKSPRRGSRHAGAPRPPTPDSSGMSDTTDSTP